MYRRILIRIFLGDNTDVYYDYVIAEHGNYQMYVIGWLEFEKLKEYAQEKLEDKFDGGEFHKIVLDANQEGSS